MFYAAVCEKKYVKQYLESIIPFSILYFNFVQASKALFFVLT